METVLAVLIIVVGVYGAYKLARLLVDIRQDRKEFEAMRKAEEAEALLAQARSRERRRQQIRTEGITNAIANTKAVPAAKPSYAPSPTQSVSSYQDTSLSDIALGMAINNALNTHVSHPSPTVKSSETSWGFDDSDSRKSASDSFSSSSDSYSSSSSDSSGPSSDW